MGGLGSEALNAITKQIWHWCIDRGNWLVCEHVRGIENCYADHLSRFFNDNIEWPLVPKIFHQLCAEFFTPEMDLFASQLNAQVDKYFSWFPDHHSRGLTLYLSLGSPSKYTLSRRFALCLEFYIKLIRNVKTQF